MRVALNQRPYDGPWGGGNRFNVSMSSALVAAGHQVVYDLSAPVDVILMVETRLRSPNVAFGAGRILRYLQSHPETLVVHRVNECDERKGKKFITQRLLRANYAADYTVFVGSWIMDLPAWCARDRTNFRTILNGADENVFFPQAEDGWNGRGRLKLVTHHWSSHPYKGFDVYDRIDNLLDQSHFAQMFDMTYIGNVPYDGYFKNIRHVKPLNGHDLANALRGHHAYVTASINEPGGNSQIEGGRCGLPLVYRRSGCLPEYCDGYGIEFMGTSDIEDALLRLRKSYDVWRERILHYPLTAHAMTEKWIGFLQEILYDRAEIVARRKLWRNPVQFLLNQIPI